MLGLMPWKENIMFKIFKKWKITIVVGFVLVLVAAVIRIYHITLLPVFADEAIYIRWSQVMNAEPTLRFLPLSDGNQPLFLWMLLFAVKRFNDQLFVGRVLSSVCVLVTFFTIF